MKPVNSSAFRLVVFDWDGTLMDSETQIVSCLHAAIRDLKLPSMDDDTVKNVIGLGLTEAIDTLVPGRDAVFHQQFVEYYRHYWFKSEGSLLFDGVTELLDEMKQAGYLLAVATGKARRGLDRVLDETGLKEHFDATRCADEAPSKPHPGMLQELLEELAVLPSDTVMVGDTEYDMEMATRAGVHKLAVSTGVHSRERLLGHQPLACLDNLSLMPAWLASVKP